MHLMFIAAEFGKHAFKFVILFLKYF